MHIINLFENQLETQPCELCSRPDELVNHISAQSKINSKYIEADDPDAPCSFTINISMNKNICFHCYEKIQSRAEKIMQNYAE